MPLTVIIRREKHFYIYVNPLVHVYFMVRLLWFHGCHLQSEDQNWSWLPSQACRGRHGLGEGEKSASVDWEVHRYVFHSPNPAVTPPPISSYKWLVTSFRQEPHYPWCCFLSPFPHPPSRGKPNSKKKSSQGKTWCVDCAAQIVDRPSLYLCSSNLISCPLS